MSQEIDTLILGTAGPPGDRQSPARPASPRTIAAAVLGYPCCDRRPGSESELAQDVLAVPLWGATGQDEPIGNLLVGETLAHEAGYLLFSGSQWRLARATGA